MTHPHTPPTHTPHGLNIHHWSIFSSIFHSIRLTRYKDCECFVQHLLTSMSNMLVESLKCLFKGFVPDTYIPQLLDCFKTASKQTLREIIFTCPTPSPAEPDFYLSVKCSDDAERWRDFCQLEAHVGFTLHNLMKEGGVCVQPVCGNLGECSVAFNATPFFVVREAIQKMKRDLGNSTKFSSQVVCKIRDVHEG